MEVAFESNASLIFDKLEKQSSKSWTNSDVNQEDYRNSWCQYRNSAQENKENIEPVVNDERLCGDETNGFGKDSKDEPMEIVVSLSTCSITNADNSSQENNSALDPPPVKRARIVKPPEAYESAQKSSPKAEPKFLARERENRERRAARKSYYDMLMKKSSPAPFKARPAPKFKPLPPTPKKFELRSSPLTQTPKSNVLQPINTPKSSRPSGIPPKALTTPKSNVLQPIPITKPSRPSGVLPQTPRATTSAKSNVLQPISCPRPSKPTGSFPQTPQGPRVPRIQVTNKTPGASQSKVSEKIAGNSGQSKVPLKRGYNDSNASDVRKNTTAQRPKPAEESPRERRVTIPKSPQLSTAIRARERQHFEEMMQEKQRQREAIKKMEIATARRYEQERIAQLRKSAVHKPLPVLSPRNGQSPMIKRTPSHPMTPVFAKRPRWV